MTNPAFSRRQMLAGSALLGAAPFLDLSAIHAQGASVLRIAMTASDIPLPNGQTDQGAEGMRFVGYNVFDSLILWDLSKANEPGGLVPGLATSWSVDAADPTRWTFVLRPGVTFHDGSPFNAETVVWNFDKILKKDSPQFDQRQAAQGLTRIPSVKAYRVVDAMTVEFTTQTANALFPYEMAWILMSSPAQWEKVGRSWDNFLKSPSGTGPWKVDRYTPRERLELVKNDAYWNPARRPKVDRVVLVPMPEATTRTAALLAGQVDWIEAPPTDNIAQLKSRGMQITSNVYPHNWTWHFSRAEGSPWNDIRIRKAANLAVDRAGMVELLGGMMLPAKGMVPPSSPWFGRPSFDVKTDIPAALKLMAEAGFSPQKPVSVKAIISPSGSGQMQPQVMNELIQQNLADIGIKVDFEVMDWNALTASWRAGARDPSSRGAHSTNSSYFSQDPFTALIRHLDSGLMPPRGTNWGYYSDPAMDALFAEMRSSFDPAKQLAAIRKAHEKFVDDALFLFVAHDVAPRALSPRVKGFVQAQNWYQDLCPVSMA
ncbi:ABC transporter substrate-binding protein [Phreatobacter aquaticus]|uniref:ABC transporter substrate-binding protein n=1 Tax=Phreatobacter aquaticus TaxID=2570229 RepID=A0A4D7QT17_9HYPH|nr:ABC transporter substrate-binding protein [Phreatobacter aquaticus]QCK88217.1 ABC transporter substrate-binding protein [Phreatobacter aquaticus]